MFEDWITLEERDFKIAFPQQPLVLTVPTPDGNGGVVPTHCYLLETKGSEDINFLYSLSYMDYPESGLHHSQFPLKIKYFLDAAANNLAAGIFTGEIRRILSTNRPTYAGRMIDIQALHGQFMYKIHLLLSGYRLYIIQTVTHNSWAENDRVKKFIASFAIQEQQPMLTR